MLSLFASKSPRPGRPQKLCSGYAELQDVDQALRDAEHRLEAAHKQFARGVGPRPDSLFREVLQLRDHSRRLLDELGDLFVEDSRFA
jgi:DNA-binding PucR family transcriptional regulator